MRSDGEETGRGNDRNRVVKIPDRKSCSSSCDGNEEGARGCGDLEARSGKGVWEILACKKELL